MTRHRLSDVADLTAYYQSAESDCGLRSAQSSIVAMIASGSHHDMGGRTNGTEDAMARRLDRPHVARHRAVRRALSTLSREHGDALWAAHGVPLSQWAPELRREYGALAGVVVCAGGGGGADVVARDRCRELAARLLAAAETAFGAARDAQDPRRGKARACPARAAGPRARAEAVARAIHEADVAAAIKATVEDLEREAAEQ